MFYCVNVLNVSKVKSHQTSFELVKTSVDTNGFIGNGFFEVPFSKEINDFHRIGLSTAKVIFYKADATDERWFDEGNKDKWDLQISSYKPYDCKIPILSLSVICDDSLYEKIEEFSDKDSEISISFNVTSWDLEGNELEENSYSQVKAKIANIQISNKKSNHSKSLIDYEIKDIESYLIRTNCVNSSSGQVAEICKEFAESFRFTPSHINKSDLLHEINSLISSYRHTFHIHLEDEDAAKVKSFTENYGFQLNPYAENFFTEFEKITEKRERYEAIKIFNHLWTWKKSEGIFLKEYHLDSDEAESIADEYIKLKYVHSQTCERILFDALISTCINDYASTALYQKNISKSALLSIPLGFYKADSVIVKDKSPKKVIFEFIFSSFFHLIGRLISGLISWWISGLIAGDNETAHIVLFGTMFAADTVLMGLYQRNKQKTDETSESAKEEHYFNTISTMCNLHTYSYFMDIKLMRQMFTQLVSSGVIFQHQIFQLLAAIELRK